MVVLPCDALSIADWTIVSLEESKADVASSKRRICGSNESSYLALNDGSLFGSSLKPKNMHDEYNTESYTKEQAG
jgi:hypothetical protein